MNGPLLPAPSAPALLALPEAPDAGTRALGEVETEIEGGWVAAAKGYREIRNGRLYLQARGRYDDFEHYCRARWGLRRDAVDKMILALKVVDTMRKNFMETAPPENAHQARALLPLVGDPPAMAQVLTEARRQAALRGTGVTAQRLAAGVRRRLAPGRSAAGEGEPEVGMPPSGPSSEPGGDQARAPEDDAYAGTRRSLDETVAGFARLSQALSAHVASVDLTVGELRRLARLIGKAQTLAQAGERLAAQARTRRTRRGGEPLAREALPPAPPPPSPTGLPGRVLASLRQRGPSTSRELAEATGLELHVVSGRLPGLRERGLVRRAAERRQRPDGRWDDVYEAVGGPG